MDEEFFFQQSTVIRATPSAVAADLNGEMIIMDVESGQYFGLEGIGADVWSIIERPTSIKVICDAIVAKYEVSREVCQADIFALIEELNGLGLTMADGP